MSPNINQSRRQRTRIGTVQILAVLSTHPIAIAQDSPAPVELLSHTGCFVSQSEIVEGDSITWSGTCLNSRAHGSGTLTVAKADEDGEIRTYEGSLENGLFHGTLAIAHSDGFTENGPYVYGKRSGRFSVRLSSGATIDAFFMNGQEAGTWTVRYPNGDTTTAPYRDGERHGTLIEETVDGSLIETPYVDGVIHGTKTERRSNGDVIETPYVDNRVEGTVSHRNADGSYSLTPWADEQLHGTVVEVNADGEITETPYVLGVIHGSKFEMQFNESSLGYVFGGYLMAISEAPVITIETPYVEGVIHGVMTRRSSVGHIVETPYVQGVIHGTVIEDYPGDSYTRPYTQEIPYVEGVIHGTFITRWEDGTGRDTPFVNGKRHGLVTSIDEHGRIVGKEPYIEDQLAGIAFTSTARCISRVSYVDGQRNGQSITFCVSDGSGSISNYSNDEGLSDIGWGRYERRSHTRSLRHIPSHIRDDVEAFIAEFDRELPGVYATIPVSLEF